MRHILSEIDNDSKTAYCAGCEDRVKLHRGSKGRWKCGIKNSEYGRLPRTIRKMADGFTYTQSQKQELSDRQGGRCAICNLEAPLEFDHNHDTLEPRGLLCHKCNTGLGMFGDSRELITSALIYLDSYL